MTNKTPQTPSITHRILRLALPLLLMVGLAGCATSASNQDSQARKVGTLEGSPVQVTTVPRATYFTGE